jgi:tripartite-type tricarboxylate transporter receptor subunit TctC
MKKILSRGLPVLAVAAVALAAAPARAEFPEKPVEMTVLFGGSAQTVGQLLADLMAKQLGKPVVAVSRPGGGGAVGYAYVQKSPADGYNIVWNSNSISTTTHRGNLPFKYDAFVPIARIGMEVPVLAVRADSGWKSLKDMAAAGKKSGKKLKVAVAGLGSFTHLTTAALFNRLGVDVIYVPGGQGREMAELLAGRVDGAMRFPSEVAQHVKAGTVVALCTTGKEKVDVGLAVPTCDEAGAKGLDLTMWRGLAAPAGTPPAVIAKLQAAAKAAAESPEFKKAAGNVGFIPAFLPAKEFGVIIASDDKEIGKLMKDTGLTKKTGAKK